MRRSSNLTLLISASLNREELRRWDQEWGWIGSIYHLPPFWWGSRCELGPSIDFVMSSNSIPSSTYLAAFGHIHSSSSRDPIWRLYRLRPVRRRHSFWKLLLIVVIVECSRVLGHWHASEMWLLIWSRPAEDLYCVGWHDLSPLDA